LNDSLCDTLTAGDFVTLFMAKLQPKTNSMVWVNAGHVPPMLMTRDEMTETTNRSGKQMFGEDRLRKWFAANQSKSLEALPSELMQELNNFGRDGHGDDLTLLFMQREKS
jgi:serine phosphatase RsbU (regulator of sigma subunit)